MRARSWIWLLAVAAAFGLSACAGTYGNDRRGSTRVDASMSYRGGDGAYDDYDALSPYGTWVAVSYGWAWCPLDVPVGWRPYTVGHWLYCDAGWMWMADDPWGAIPYHYGRWAYDDFYGWVWVPGDVWAPAWVSWRYSDDWIGWAPLPPEVGWQVGVGIRYSSSTIDRRVDPQSWCFVPSSHFLDDGVRTRLVPPSRNVTIISTTRNVTQYVDDGARPAERGLRPDWVSHATGRPVTRYRVNDSPSTSYGVKPAVQGDQVTIYRAGPPPDREMRARGADDRIKAQPPQRDRGRPTPRLVERQRSERAQMGQQMKEERDQLNQIHERERREPPPGVSREALQKRQDAENRAQDNREARMRRAFDQRRQKFEASRGNQRDDSSPSQNDDRDDNDKRGRGRGRGQGERSL